MQRVHTTQGLLAYCGVSAANGTAVHAHVATQPTWDGAVDVFMVCIACTCIAPTYSTHSNSQVLSLAAGVTLVTLLSCYPCLTLQHIQYMSRFHCTDSAAVMLLHAVQELCGGLQRP